LHIGARESRLEKYKWQILLQVLLVCQKQLLPPCEEHGVDIKGICCEAEEGDALIFVNQATHHKNCFGIIQSACQTK